MRRLWHLKTIAVLIFATTPTAWAALGESAASVQADQVHMKATLRPATSNTNFTVHEIQTPAGITVKEFVPASGTVFAVAWTGPTMPDLQQLLGQYFNSYVTAATAKHAGHKHLSISQPGLVVESQGHMRAFFGKAYLPDKLPAGVTAAELQ
jgi:hypothetical protein